MRGTSKERILQHVWNGQRERGLGGDTVIYKENGQVSNASSVR